MQTARRESIEHHVKWRQRWGWCFSKPKTARKSPEAEREAWHSLSHDLHKERTLPTPWSWTWPAKLWDNKFLSFKSPTLWCFFKGSPSKRRFWQATPMLQCFILVGTSRQPGFAGCSSSLDPSFENEALLPALVFSLPFPWAQSSQYAENGMADIIFCKQLVC